MAQALKSRSGVVLSGVGRAVSVRNPGSLEDLKLLCQQKAEATDYQLATAITSNIPQYDLSSFSLSNKKVLSDLQDEWYRVLASGPGVLVLKSFFTNTHVLEASNSTFDHIIEAEATSSKGDHFAAGGANSRIWNSFQKHAETDPKSFVSYYSNPWLARVSEAWLGPNYQITAQVNIVRPGGKPQSAHRDYHLGFQTAEACAAYPSSMQFASQYLTLQGGVAHSKMPLESGPTRILPFSQLLPEGYLAWRLPEFTSFFNDHWVSLPMEAGDAVFFNPALFHAAGENSSKDIHRSANLLQVSSAFGRPMETVNTVKIIQNCWNDLKEFAKQDGNGDSTAACVTAISDGYPFPSNLDRRPPGPDGMAPTSETDVVWQGLREDWNSNQVVTAIGQLRLESSS